MQLCMIFTFSNVLCLCGGLASCMFGDIVALGLALGEFHIKELGLLDSLQVLVLVFDPECLLLVFGQDHYFIDCESIGGGFYFLGQVNLAFSKMDKLVLFGLGEIQDGIHIVLILQILIENL